MTILIPLLLDEPELEFGDGGKHIDPRIGLLRHGPLQPILGDKISIGVVGTAETVEGFERWIDRVKSRHCGQVGKATEPLSSVSGPRERQPVPVSV